MSVDDLLLRGWTMEDVTGLRAAIDDGLDHLKPWLTWTLEEPASPAVTERRLRRWIAQHEAGQAARYAIVPRDRPATILGDVHLNRRGGPDPDDLGYWVRLSAARQGIATAAVARLVVHAFEDRALPRLNLHTDVANAPSAAFARKLGFDELGPGTMTLPDGSERPVTRFAMTADAYARRHADRLRDAARTTTIAAG